MHPKYHDCTYPGCTLSTGNPTRLYCTAHIGGRERTCLHEGCDELPVDMAIPAGYCYQHMSNKDARKAYNKEQYHKKREREREMVERWCRDRHLRATMLPGIAEEQDNKCPGFWTCETVDDGNAVNMCPWGERKVPTMMQELDHHPTPVSQGGGDERENLQMLCACCHAAKTAAERGASSVGQPVES
jgi:5-methylcytosine-specific restriction endonuclease McrA